MDTIKKLVFYGLAAASAALFVASFLMPWWTADLTVQGFSVQRDAIQIFGYGLSHNMGQLTVYILDQETPYYQTVLAYVYLGVSIGMVVLGSMARNKKARWLLVITGMVYMVYLGTAAFILSGNLGEYDISLTGWSTYRAPARSVTFFTQFLPGYYLGLAGGAGLVISGLLGRYLKKANNYIS
ncbi:MAG: hypothetical protein PHT28_05280 [Dehalococcoidales bacterium]|jgi:uncharacterized protein YybS (DUF2232 family)|nr:hypothetical protein [Dehalococcoidales bacterium]MDD4230651.1 hypothetical protein [Dehalococcoidales bacterium]MDD4466112.1 hypothetical protein [Dehalococcoidales bacterium]